jgi:hypothetical protein
MIDCELCAVEGAIFEQAAVLDLLDRAKKMAAETRPNAFRPGDRPTTGRCGLLRGDREEYL